nr:MAG TPA: FecR protein [Caudoviricetes sp.]
MNKRVKKLFERYQSGQANNQERKIVEDWFASFEKADIEEISTKENLDFFSPMDEKINQMLFAQPRHSFGYKWLYAAAALILISFGITWFKHDQTADKEGAKISYSIIAAPKGTKKRFSLPDGSWVSLNSGSHIRIPSNFGIKSREVSLSGEAFFSIKHNAAKSFTIHSSKLLITDLGTEFDVKAYPEEQKIQIAVESGKVKVEKNSGGRKPEMFAGAITHNQQLVYDKQSNKHALSQVQTSDLTAWQYNKLCFNNASMDEISHTLERWYNVTIKLKNNKECRRYTVSFNNEPFDQVLNVLTRLTGLRYQMKNKIVLINLKNCTSMK